MVVGYDVILAAGSLPEIDVTKLRHNLRTRGDEVWQELHVSPRLAPSANAHLCTYFRWFQPFARAATILRLPISHTAMRQLLCSELGDAACPLCGEHDGITHVLGNCSHPLMKAMYIERHNAATRKILRLILEGSRGSCYMLADVGSTDRLGNVGPLDSRLPEWLVPTNILQQRGLDRDKLRPDILMTSSTPATPWGLSSSIPSRTSTPGAGTHPMGKRIWIVEVGYCAATGYHDKMTEKQQQHAQLISLLESLDYRVITLPVLLGTTGEIFHSTDIKYQEYRC